MLDFTTEKGRIVSAALALAAERKWSALTLSDIAQRAGVSLVTLKGQFSSKGDILKTLSRMVDDEVLARATPRREGETARDALFEVIMSRFDVLAPFKPALKAIAADWGPELPPIGRILASQRWMLEAAGVGTDGPGGAVRTLGLAGLYGAVFRTWLDDEDPGHSRTMAALDRRLRQGERSLESLEGLCKGLGRIACAVRNVGRRRADSAAPPPTPATPAAPGGASV